MKLIFHRRSSRQKLNQSGIVRQAFFAAIVFLVVFSVKGAVVLAGDHDSLALPVITSGIKGYCLDDYHNGKAPNAIIDSWACNGTTSQDWTFQDGTLKHDDLGCLAVSGTKVVLSSCNGSTIQKWQLDIGGYESVSNSLCLAVPHSKVATQLDTESCNDLANFNEAWTATLWSAEVNLNLSCDKGTEGDKVACYAEKQWNAWQSGSPSHVTLLDDYTDGNSSEPWCADFVSYIYREAGYPFSDGQRDGWDQVTADDIQYMGFSLHMANSGYQPKPGDVAYFDYPGGHVEIVVTGGKSPTFIFGNSGTLDPKTGNGELAKDSLTSDGSAGEVVYYLSPN